jgi:AcrR family transcriptional regulator
MAHVRKAQRTRALLLAAAVDIIGHKGYSATTVDEVAEKAGVSKGVLYYHFASKAEMATAILEDGLTVFSNSLEYIGQKAQNGVAGLSSMAEAFATMVDSNRQFTKFLLSEIWREDREWRQTVKQCEDKMCATISDQVLRGQMEGTLRQDIDASFVATAFLGMCLSLSLDWVTYHPTQSKEDFVKSLTNFASRGIVS